MARRTRLDQAVVWVWRVALCTRKRLNSSGEVGMQRRALKLNNIAVFVGEWAAQSEQCRVKNDGSMNCSSMRDFLLNGIWRRSMPAQLCKVNSVCIALY